MSFPYLLYHTLVEKEYVNGGFLPTLLHVTRDVMDGDKTLIESLITCKKIAVV